MDDRGSLPSPGPLMGIPALDSNPKKPRVGSLDLKRFLPATSSLPLRTSSPTVLPRCCSGWQPPVFPKTSDESMEGRGWNYETVHSLRTECKEHTQCAGTPEH